MPPSPALVHGALLLVSVLFGCNFVYTKVLVAAIGVDAWLFYRLAAASLVLVPLALLRPHRALPRRTWGRLALACFLGIVVNQLLFTEGLARTTPEHSAVINSMIPVLTLVFAVLWGHETFTRRKVTAVCVSVLGVLVLFGVDQWFAGGSPFGETLHGDLLTLGNATAFSLFLVIMGPLSREVDPLAMAAALVAGGAIFFAFWSWDEINGETLRLLLQPGIWSAALIVVLGSTVVTYLLNNWALRHTQSSGVALYIVLQPIVATGLGALEGLAAPDLRFYLAALLVVAGLVIRIL